MGDASRQPVQALGAVIVLWIAAYWVRSPAGSAMLDEPAFGPASPIEPEADHESGAGGPTGEAVMESGEIGGAGEDSGNAGSAEFDWSPGGKELARKTTEATREVRTHTVRRGDTLGSIALRAYGSVRYAETIYRANRGILRSPDALDVGMVLTLPEIPPP